MRRFPVAFHTPYRQRLAHTPIGNHPVWVEDAHFNIDYHVRHSALPKPGDERQLKRLAARLIAQHLDRQKPLWEIWILEGLANPAHFVMISKIHHSMVDGMSSVDRLKVPLTLEPIQAPEPPSRCIPRPAPSRWNLAIDALERYVHLPIDTARNLPQIWQGASDPDSGIRAGLNIVRETLGTGLRVSDTPLNQRIGPHRRLEWLTMDLAIVKAAKKRPGGTLNDTLGVIPLTDSLCLGIVLFSYAGKLRWGFTSEWDVLPDLYDFVSEIETSFRKLCDAPARIEVPAALPTAAPARCRQMRPAQRGLPDRPSRSKNAAVVTTTGVTRGSSLRNDDQGPRSSIRRVHREERPN